MLDRPNTADRRRRTGPDTNLVVMLASQIPSLNGRPPIEGGMYTPKCPPVELRGNSLTPRQKRRPRGEARGYPGERIG